MIISSKLLINSLATLGALGAVGGGYYALKGNTSSNEYQDFEIELDLDKLNEFGKKLFSTEEGKKFCDEMQKEKGEKIDWCLIDGEEGKIIKAKDLSPEATNKLKKYLSENSSSLDKSPIGKNFGSEVLSDTLNKVKGVVK